MFASKSARNRCSDLRFVSCWPMFDSTRGPVGVVKRRCVQSTEYRVQSAECRVQGTEYKVQSSAWSLQRFLPKLVRTSLWAVFAAYRVFDPRFVSCWPMFADLSVVKRRCAPCLLKLRSRLRETRNRIQKIDPSRSICSILLF